MVYPLALSVSGGIEKLGAYAGLASLFAIVLLILLYFAQARELKRLSQWAARQPEQLRQPLAQPTPPPTPAAPLPPTAGVVARPTGGPVVAASVPGVRRVPTPIPSAGSAAGIAPTTPAGALAQEAGAGTGEAAGAIAADPAAPGAPLAAAPAAEQAAEKQAAAGQAAAEQAGEGDPPTASPAGGETPETSTTARPAAEQPAAVGPPAADAAVTGEVASSAEPARPAAVPLVAAPVPARAAQTGLAEEPAAGLQPPAPPLPPAPHKDSPIITPPPPGAPRPSRGRRGRMGGGEHEGPLAASSERLRRLGAHGGLSAQAGRRRLVAFIALAVLVVAVVAAVALGSGGSRPRSTPAAAKTGTSATTAPVTSPTVAVLNGTSIVGLASNVSAKLTGDGFRRGTVADAPDQATATTTVGYTSGYQAAAVKIAHDLGLGGSAAVPVSTTDEAAARVGGQTPQVVVTIGANYPQ